MRFLTDITLGKLTKWLRILGHDTALYRGNSDQLLIRMAKQEDRLVLTRKQNLRIGKHNAKLLVVIHDKVEAQLKEVMEKLSLSFEPQHCFTRCIKCNEQLALVSKEEVTGLIPDYVSEKYNDFRRCPSCKGIFWPGTHRDHMQTILKIRSHFHPL